MLVRPLGGVDRADLASVGGKAANLGELIRAGFRVPDGFVITTDAYTLAVGGGVASADSRARLLTSAVPATVASAVRDAYRAMGSPHVAVRSSATAEDLPDASFAGQQDTILDVAGDDAVLEAVRRCWASLWNDRAVAYRATHAVDNGSVRLAVVVQRMVDADVAGVLFTADPITGTRRRVSVDAVRGLGERLVSGQVNPDHYVVDARDGAIVERRGDTLDDARLRELAATGMRIEEHYGRPQDIEWAYANDRTLWIVQSRDVTTLYPLPSGLPDPDRELRVLASANVPQGVFDPLTPMGIQTFRLIASSFARLVGAPPADPVAGPPVVHAPGMRLFIDLTAVLRNKFARGLPARVMSVMEARSVPLFIRLLDDPRLAPTGGSRVRSALGTARAVMRTGAPAVIVRALLRPDATRERLLREIDELVRMDVGTTQSARERVDAFEALLLGWPARAFPRLVAMVAAGFVSYNAAGRILGRRATQDELRTVLRGLPFNPTTEMDLALWALSRRVRTDAAARAALAERSPEELSAAYRAGALPPLLQRELAAFLERYGHRAVAEIDLGLPRWSEDPAHLLGAIANYQRLADEALAPDAQFARGAREAESMVGTLAARVHGPERALVRALLRRVRALSGVREAPKFHAIRVFARGRAMLAPVGTELAAAGRIDSPDDIWFLTLPELRRAVAGEDTREIVSARRAEYRRERGRRHIPRILLSDGTDAEAAYVSPAADGAIRGTPASPGVAQGTARVILSPVGARLEPGEVLVAPSTDPGWTPLFLTASALVMEMGGMMSHGAVVAREYGIPAVVGVPDATGRIATGARLTVDGSAGTVALES